MHADERILRDGKGNESRINLAHAGCYAVALNGRIHTAPTVQALRDKARPLGWQ